MPHVTVYYEMFLPGGHHRQPRNTSVELDLAPSSGADVSVGGVYTPTFFPELPYTYGGSSGMASLLFWSVTDGTNGQVLPPAAFNQTVGGLPLTITAWYFPTGGGGGGGGPEIIDDAFSANLGRFIDDTFVDVTSDPSLTSNANVVGIVPTSMAETLVAKSSVVSTPEPFREWILNGTVMPVGNATLNVAAGTLGIAIAIYQQAASSTTLVPPNVSIYNPWWWISSWWGVGPDPGPEMAREFAVAVQLIAVANNVSPQLRAQVLQAALAQVQLIVSTLQAQIQGAQG